MRWFIGLLVAGGIVGGGALNVWASTPGSASNGVDPALRVPQASSIIEAVADCAGSVLRRVRVLALTASAQDAMLASRFDEAYADLIAALTLDPANPVLYVLRGQANLALYAWDASEADYNMALTLDPGYADAYFYRGVLRYSILQTGLLLREDALADFETYLELAPSGRHAEDAARYAESIRQELEALAGGE